MPDQLLFLPEKNMHSTLHEFVRDTIAEWKDKTAFGTWLGVCQRFLDRGGTMYQLGIMKGSLQDANVRSKGAVFFSKVRKSKGV